MIRISLAAAAALLVFLACATSKPLEASATVEEIPNEASASAGAADAGPAPFLKLEAPEGFAVMFPDPLPEAQRKTVPSNAGEIATAAWNLRTAENITYSVSLVDYPEKLVRVRRPEVFLNEARDGLVNQLKGTIRDEQDITVDGHPGKSYTVSSEAGELRARNYLVGPRLYTMFVLYSPNLGAPRADEFLNSLTLTTPVQAIYKGAGMDAGTMMGDGGTLMMDGEEAADAGVAMTPDAGTAKKPAKKRK